MASHQYFVYVCLLLKKGNNILLLKRANTGWMDGYWHIPGGTLEEDESLTHAVTREGKEELAVDVDPVHVKLIHVQHLNKKTLGFYFIAYEWKGEPKNNEPNECSEIRWFDSDKLPDDMSPFARRVIETYKGGGDYSYFE